MKVCVYTIALNEADEVAGWLASTKDADQRLVLDTGSMDGTDHLLAEFGVIVHHGAIKPWRFDDAFNAALTLIPGDIDVVFRVDMDERPRNGWRQAIAAAFDETTTLLRYPYHWSRASSFYGDRIHRRYGYRWKGPTHEGLVWRGQGPQCQKFVDTIVVDHFQKPKSRPNDLSLLQEAVAEYPNDSRLCLYYARELVFAQQHSAAISELRRFQQFSVDPTDLAFSHRLLAQIDQPNCLSHLTVAAATEQSASVDLALASYWYDKDWARCYAHVLAAIERSTEMNHWTADLRLKSEYPYDIASVAAWKLGKLDAAKQHVMEAFRRAPNDPRIANNVRLICQHPPQGVTNSSIDTNRERL